MKWNLIIEPLFMHNSIYIVYIIIYGDDYKFYIWQRIYYEVTLKS